jgi:chloramphenicol 3-O phosphotransferase
VRVAEAERREALRRDGTAPGTARAQIDKVHAHGLYDIEVDTTAASADHAAVAIVRGIKNSASAFHRLAYRKP